MDQTAPENLPPTMSGKQTLSFLQRVFRAHGIEAKSKLGQNFLIDMNLLDFIVRTAEVSKQDSVLEVGTGTGSLTSRLADAAGWVTTVEIDAMLQPIAEQMCAGRFNISHVRGDCLAKKSVLNPQMLATWSDNTKKDLANQKLVANLPYSIATPLMSNLIVSEIPIERMVVMVQWEIGTRLTAVPGTKDYNSLSVLFQSIADVSIVRKVAPTNFHPRPMVDSAIVMVKPNAEKRAVVGDPVRFRNFLRDLYVHRRKNLRVALASSPKGRRDKKEVDAQLQSIGIDGNVRAETLDLEQHLRLAKLYW
jgi:16S rRNA (adenine1518-N6/adenine1519-N6)-dimethyltransferase